MRERLDLDGVWQFWAGTEDDTAPAALSAVRAITVPGPWQAQFEDLRTKAGTAWYRRTLQVPASWRESPVFLCFGAVNYHTRVWVNDTLVGENEGGYLPFEFPVHDLLRHDGPNDLLVQVTAPLDDPELHGDAPFAEIPFGKQSWYGPLSGIWQSVWLERRSVAYIRQIRLLPRLDDGLVTARLAVEGAGHEPLSLAVEIEDLAGAAVAFGEVAVPMGATSVELTLQVPEPQSWSPDTPHLYRFIATLLAEDRRAECRHAVRDRASERFGFRTIETRNGRLWLNGEPFYLRGALDQDYYPDGICTPPSLSFLEDQLRKAKELGVNCLRCHIKVPDPRYYEVADRLGMLVWTELPNCGQLTASSRARVEATLRAIVERDGNHPSIICWTIINENWGTDLVHNAEHRAWLKRTYLWLKAFDPTRLVVDNSPLAPSMHVQTDIADYHHYCAIPDQRHEWDRFLDDYTTRPAWLFSRHGDAVATGREPLIVSEFGNWGLPDPADLADAEGREPWWFETGHDWADGVMYPHGVERRFADWSLGRVFGSLRGFVEAAQWQQFRALKYQIEAMRRRPRLAGYVITELTDCHWESNGLLDMRRNPRVFHHAFRSINADTVVVPGWQRLSYWSGETVRFDPAVAHGAGPTLEGAVLEVSLGDAAAVVPVPPVSAGEVRDLGAVMLPVIATQRASIERARFELRGRDGTIIATNHADLAVHPAPSERSAIIGTVWSPDPAILERLIASGYAPAPSMETASLVVAGVHDPALQTFVRTGGRLLLLCETPGTLTPFFPHWQNVRVEQRAGSPWQGSWASSFAWLRRTGAFARLPGGPLLDEAFDRVIPRHVIAGTNLLDFQGRVHGGMVVGWVHKPVALVVERGYGQGRIVATTFRLLHDIPLADPTATLLLDGLVELAGGDAVQRRGRHPEAPVLA